jgi:hypothetical protein
MTLLDLLHTRSKQIIDEATETLQRSRLSSYQQTGKERTHHRLMALYVLTTRAVQEHNIGPMLAHATTVAQERFNQGFDLSEVQTAFNVLEEIIWRQIVKEMEQDALGEALGLVSTVLGAGKDALAREYVSLASKTKAPSMNMQSLFAGIEG